MANDPQTAPMARLEGREAWHWGVAGAAALAVLLTFLYLVRFAYPVNDDWSFAAAGRDAGVWSSVSSYWNDFGGRWSAGILLYGLGVFPDLPAAYPLLIAALLAAQIGAGWLLLQALGLRDRQRLWISAMVLAAVQYTALPVLDVGNLGPHVALPETLYWVSGAVNYSLSYPLIALVAWLACRLRRRWAGWGIAILGGLWISGLSEMAGIGAAAVGIVLGCMGHRRGWVLAAAALAGLGIVACAPGNAKRLEILRQESQGGSGLTHIPQAMWHATAVMGQRWLAWLLNPAIVALLGIAAHLGGHTPAPDGARACRPLLALAVAAVVATWGMAVPTMALVGFLEARHEGLISLCAVAALVGISWKLGQTWPAAVQGRRCRRVWLAWLGVAIAVRYAHPPAVAPLGTGWCALILLCAGGICVVQGFRGMRIAGAALACGLLMQPTWWQGLGDAWGKAPALRARQQERDDEVARLVAAGFDRVLLPWLAERKDMPRTIRIYELQPGWMVEAYGGYHRLRQVRISPRIAQPMGIIDPPEASPQP